MNGIKKVVVGMSGGIDSSVAALLLKNQGYEVIGLSLKHLDDEMANINRKTCCSLDDINDAKIVCYQLNIPHFVLNVSSEFKNKVIDNFLDEYDKGNTPSPCIICDEKVKMRKILDFAKKIGANYVATGHYAKLDSENRLLLDKNNPKDQSYMLYRLALDDLKYFIFPLSKYSKEEVRKIARENGIVTHNKPDSQGICFAPNGYISFLKERLKEKIKPGYFKDEKGNILGMHEGYQLYTIGQRRNLGLNLGKAFFVKKIDPINNEIILSDFNSCLVDRIKLTNFILNIQLEKILNIDLLVKPRFSSKGLIAKLEYIDENNIYIKYKEKNAQNAPGQHLVIYLEGRIVAGGKIERIFYD